MLKQPFSTISPAPSLFESSPLFVGVHRIEKTSVPNVDDDNASVVSLEDVVFEPPQEQNAKASSPRNAVTPVASNLSRRVSWYDKTIPSTDAKGVVVPHRSPLRRRLENSFEGTRKMLFPSCHIEKPARSKSCPIRVTNAYCHSPISLTSDSSNLPVAVAVASPVTSPTEYKSSCCDLCSRKEREIKRQVKQINQLQNLVTQMVGVLGKALEPKLDKSKLGLHLQSSQGSGSSSDCSDTAASSSADDGESQADSVSSELLFSGALESGTEASGENPGASTCFLRICREKAQEKTLPSCRKLTSGKRLRHAPVTVAGVSGYYSGPSFLDDSIVRSCVIRFENGDQYLGEVRGTAVQSVLELHGMGAFYRKDGSIARGRFSKNQLVA